MQVRYDGRCLEAVAGNGRLVMKLCLDGGFRSDLDDYEGSLSGLGEVICDFIYDFVRGHREISYSVFLPYGLEVHYNSFKVVINIEDGYELFKLVSSAFVVVLGRDLVKLKVLGRYVFVDRVEGGCLDWLVRRLYGDVANASGEFRLVGDSLIFYVNGKRMFEIGVDEVRVLSDDFIAYWLREVEVEDLCEWLWNIYDKHFDEFDIRIRDTSYSFEIGNLKYMFSDGKLVIGYRYEVGDVRLGFKLHSFLYVNFWVGKRAIRGELRVECDGLNRILRDARWSKMVKYIKF